MRFIRSTTRLSSTLAENLEKASRFSPRDKIISAPAIRDQQKDEGQKEQYREMFLKPNRKLQAQQRIEQMTGRAEQSKRSQRDIMDRMSIRTPRREEMAEDQDWPSVWPAAASFRASVVPLPVRMGTRKKPENRPPFKTFGNLELLKIPNFLHLTPEHIRRHCEAIKQFFTVYPKELKEDPTLVDKYMPLTISYSDYVHQGTSIRDMRARIVTISIDVSDLHLDEHAEDKLRRLVGNRYHEETNTLTIVTDRCYTRKQNRDYADYLLTVLYHESNKVEEWEKEKTRVDNWKVTFEGSSLQKRLESLHQLSKDNESPAKIQDESAVKEFAQVRTHYRNNNETEEATRKYAESVRKLLNMPSVFGTQQKAEVKS